MKKIFLLCLFLYGTNLSAQNCDTMGLRITLNIKDTSIHPYQPFSFLIELKNTSSNDKIIELWNNLLYQTIIQYQEVGDSVWSVLPYFDDSFQHEFIEQSKKYILNSDDSIEFKNEWLKMPKCRSMVTPSLFKNIFNEGTQYNLRAKVKVCFSKGDYLYSNIVSIKISSYSPKEKTALNYLEEKIIFPGAIYACIYEDKYTYTYNCFSYTFLRDYDIDLKSELEKFIIKFPDTEFTPWCKLFLSSVYFFNLKREPIKHVTDKNKNHVRIVMNIESGTKSDDLLNQLEQEIAQSKDKELLLQAINALQQEIKRFKKYKK